MPPQLALFSGVCFVIFAFCSDRRRFGPAPASLFWPIIWYLIVSSRPFGVWLSIFGVPIGAGGGAAEDGSAIDRNFYLVLSVIGLWILTRRHFDWRQAVRQNPWVTALLISMAISILWSDYPFVSFKRFIKVLGSVFMALVVLTDGRPFEAFLTVLRRCLYIHLPMSIICAKYFRNIGVAYTWEGTGMWQGISTSKNTLGQIAMLGLVYFAWDVRKHWALYGWRNISLAYLLMAVYLLKGSPSSVSKTSVVTGVLALLMFVRLQSLRYQPDSAVRFVRVAFAATIALIGIVLLHSVVVFSADSLFGYIITKLGRDITLTDRLYIWSDVYAVAHRNPLFGVGFGGFWIGRNANIPWNATKTWVLGQAHSGYVDTYLQLGWMGAFILAGLFLFTLKQLVRAIREDDFDFSCFRIAIFITILFVNMMETTLLRGDHQLWFVMLLIVLVVRPQAVPDTEGAPDVTRNSEYEPAHSARL